MTTNPWQERRQLLVAHRGGAREAPENTLHAFRYGVACGAHMLELDVRATLEGELVVMHDPLLDRTTDGSGPIAEQRSADVRALDAAHWFVPGRGAVPAAPSYPLRGVATGAAAPPMGVEPGELRVPTLEAALRTFPDTWITMELKAPGIHQHVAELLAALGREHDVIVGGFVTDRVAEFRSAAPQVATSAAEAEVAAFWAWAHGLSDAPAALPYAVLQVPPAYEGVEVVTERFVTRAHDCGIAVHVWTVDDAGDMHRLLDLGVDGVMTDRPTVLAKVLEERTDCVKR